MPLGGIGLDGRPVFDTYLRLKQPVRVQFGKQGSVSLALGVGAITVRGAMGEPVTLRDVLHVPDLISPLLSVSCVVNDGLAVHFDPPAYGGGPHRVALLRDGRALLTATQRDGMYWLDSPQQTSYPTAISGVAVADLHAAAHAWHERLGHLSYGSLAQLKRGGFLPNCELAPRQFVHAGGSLPPCEPCLVGKTPRLPHPPRTPRELTPGQRLHSDVCSLPKGVFAIGGYVAFHTLIDEATRFCLVTLLRDKRAATRAQCDGEAWFHTQTGRMAQRVRSDNGGEYTGLALAAWHAARGTDVEFSPAYTPQANGLAERHNRTLLDKALPMLMGSALDGQPVLGRQYIGHAIHYANALHNALPCRGALHGPTPHDGLLPQWGPVRLDAFHAFGCVVWVAALAPRNKLAPHMLKARFLGLAQPLNSGFVLAQVPGGHISPHQQFRFGAPGPPPIECSTHSGLPVTIRAPDAGDAASAVPAGGEDEDVDAGDDDGDAEVPIPHESTIIEAPPLADGDAEDPIPHQLADIEVPPLHDADVGEHPQACPPLPEQPASSDVPQPSEDDAADPYENQRVNIPWLLPAHAAPPPTVPVAVPGPIILSLIHI